MVTKSNFVKTMIGFIELIHSFDDEELIFLKKMIETEMEDRKLKIESDYDIRPKRSWIVRFLRKMGS